MAFPDFTSEIAFGTDPTGAFADADWTDVSAGRLRLVIRAGRQSIRDRTETGSGLLVLEDVDGDYDPSNASSPYWPNLIPRRRVRHRATVAGVGYDLHAGYVDPDGFQQPRESPTYAETTVRSLDMFELLATTKIPAGTACPEELSGARIDRMLDLAGIPAGDRAVDAGQTLVQAAAAGDLDGGDVLSHIFLVADTERGFPLCDGQGRFVFHDRHHRLKSPYTVSQATFSDDPGPGEFPYAACVQRQSTVVNVWRVTRLGGVEAVAFDQDSIDRYGRSERSLSTLHVTDAEALEAAQFELSRSKDPHTIFESITLEPLDDDDLWAQALGLPFASRITVKGTAPGAGAQVVLDCHIDAVTLDPVPLSLGVARVTFGLTTAERQAFLVADDPVNGRRDFNAFAY